MRINKFCLQHRNAFSTKELGFTQFVNIFHSNRNSTGKTTLMRAVLYAIGFSMPNTELVHFEDFKFRVELTQNNNFYNVERKGNLLIINGNEYDLPMEQRAAHAFLFGISNAEILNNILGTIYFDQEKGWTLLNRGTIIGINRFNVESFFRGLKEDESEESYQIVEKISALNKKIAQYKLMLNVAEYQASLSQNVEHKLDFQTYQQGLDSSLTEKRIQLQKVEEEISRITDVMKKNKHFSDYIELKKVYIKNPSGGTPIRVTKETLLEYDSVEEVNIARKSMLLAERNTIKRQIAAIEASQEKQTTFLNLPTVDEEMTRRLASISGISSVEVNTMLNRFIKEKNALSDKLKQRTKMNNIWIDDAYKIISDYARELNIPFDYKIDIFTSNLKSKSGTILHKMVFIYKLAYIKLLSKKLGYPVPIFCDSPSGREVKKEIITEMLSLLSRDFSEHQIYIASIYKYEDAFSSANVIELCGTLFNESTLLNSN